MRGGCHGGRQRLSWADELVSADGWFVFDCETTGLGLESEMVEVALIDAAGKTVYHSLIRPECQVEREAEGLHRLTAEELALAPSFPDVYGDLARLMRGRTVVSYHAAFDRMILDGCCRRRGLPRIRANWVCVLEKYRLWTGFGGGLVWVCTLEGIRVDGCHRAVADALLTWRLIQRMAGRDPDRAL